MQTHGQFRTNGAGGLGRRANKASPSLIFFYFVFFLAPLGATLYTAETAPATA